MALLLPPTPVPSLAAYVDGGGGEGLATALELTPEEVIDEVRESRLRGRGGAGFLTGTKWASVREGARESDSTAYLVCNGAEGEPGTAKDRALVAANPFQLIEGICIALHGIGAVEAVIGVKAHDEHQVTRLRNAVDEATAAGWEGADRIIVVTGPDEYLYGEESAMLEVIEHKLPMPRILPPYMQGLHATMDQPNPTAVNNVETLSHVAHVFREGAAAWRQVGTETAAGTMIFTVSGDCTRPGLYELPLGTSLRELLVDHAGAEDIGFVISGVSNTVITPRLLDLPMDFDSFAEAGTGLGSGGFVVYGSHRDVVQVTERLAEFLAVESCGQCNACQLGTATMADALKRIDAGDGTTGDLAEIRATLSTVTNSRRCYLPVGAQLTIGSMMEEFGEAFRSRLGVPGDPEVAVDVPKIVLLEDGVVRYDPDYHRKRRDWSYPTTEPGDPDGAAEPESPR
jgi:NADH:ubiquinone oxidoreductase subunit F (NADH-binding)